jgi:hypothetical protein
MKPVRLEFVLSGGAWHRWLTGHRGQGTHAFVLGLLLLSLSALGFVGWQSWETRRQLAATQDALQAAQTAKGQRRPLGVDVKPTLAPAQRTAWNRIARQLNTPWSALLDALESGTPENIALVSIEPDAAQGTVRVQAEGKTLDSLLAYAGALKAIDRFESVALIKHETNDQDSTRPLRLSLDIRFNSNTPSSSPAHEVAR